MQDESKMKYGRNRIKKYWARMLSGKAPLSSTHQLCEHLCHRPIGENLWGKDVNQGNHTNLTCILNKHGDPLHKP